MKKRLCSTLMLASIILSASAAVETGKTYRIAPVSDTSKSLFVKNAAYDNLGDVVLWTETNVPAQQWTATANNDGRFSFMNVHTGKYLNYANQKLLQISQSSSYWMLEAVDEANNIYCLKRNSTATTYLNATELTDGTIPTLKEEKQEWQFIEVEPQSELNDYVRQRMADGYLRQFMQDRGTGYRTFTNGGWDEAETQEAILDMYEATGDPRYLGIYEACYSYFKYHVGNKWNAGTIVGGYGWYGYSFNDDVMWQIIGAARAYLLTGNRTYINDAKLNFDLIWNRAYLGYVGLLRWAEQDGDRNSANSCINGPAAVAACYIAVGTGDSTYFAKARELYLNQRVHLYEPNTGKVYDNIVFNPNSNPLTYKSRNTWSSTYNQGTMLGAAILLHRHYGDEMFRKDADKILEFTRRDLCNADGIIKVCQVVRGDLKGFKGILMRYAGLYAREYNDVSCENWIKKNAMRAYSNMNSKGFGHSAWLTKSDESMMYGEDKYDDQAFGGNTSLSAAFAVRLGDDPVQLTTADDAAINTADSIIFNYNAERKGRYELKIFYRTDKRLTMYTTVNGGNRQTRYYDNTQEALYQKQLYITLRQGDNKIELKGIDGIRPQVEKIHITYLTDVSDVLEAEFATTKGNLKVENNDLASNGRYISTLGNGTSNTLTFTYEADEEGEYDLHITYFTGEPRRMTIAAGKTKLTETFAKTGSYTPTTATIKTLRVQLATGTNTIVFSNASGWAPNIDKIELERISGYSSDGISSPTIDEAPMADGPTGIYTLSGIPVKDPSKAHGILIVNGKKTVIKR